MGFRIGSFRLALSAAMLIALTALPATWPVQDSGSVLGPATAWAGGTPDETLVPPPPPSKKASDLSLRYVPSTSTSSAVFVDRTARHTNFTKFDRLMSFWTFVRAITLRM
jgi:hypothetical protein